MKKGIGKLFLCLLFVPFGALAQDVTDTKASAFNFEASYIGDVVSNFHGGIKKGTTYLGLANVKANFDTQIANWWKGGEFFINIGNTHGGEPSANLIGDFQGVSNIEAGNLTFLYELWYKHRIGNVNIILGLQDLNANFAASKNGALFTNSSFGIQSSISDNISIPVFPLTALGVNFNWKIAKDFNFKFAIFDGTPDDFKTNPFNINWKLSKAQGYLSVAEFQSNKSILKNQNASYKFGVYFHEHNDTVAVEQHNGGFYFIVDQQISSKISLFSQIGFSPKSINLHNHYFSLGANYRGIIKNRPEDQFGFAFAYAGIDDNIIGSETAIELTYLFQISKNYYLRPDIQYIINPAGTKEKLENSFVGFIRFGVNF
jgi:porin